MPSRTYTTRIQRAEARSETLRATIPQVVVAVLDLQRGDELAWTVDPNSRRVTVAKAEPKRTGQRS